MQWRGMFSIPAFSVAVKLQEVETNRIERRARRIVVGADEQTHRALHTPPGASAGPYFAATAFADCSCMPRSSAGGI